MKNKEKRYLEFCTGCGLCSAVKGVALEKDEKGFWRPASGLKEDELEFLEKVCPVSGVQCSKMSAKIWGEYSNALIGYSSDPKIRHDASSGGALTSILLYLLDHKMIDAVIHVKENCENPIESIVACSTTKEQIIGNSGSRYCSTATLHSIGELMEADCRYALVGKPCDITAMRNYAEMNARVNEKIPYMLSFFCAGAPSENAQYQLLKKVGCPQEECMHIQYRGNGWPGYATAEGKDGKQYKTTYQEAWSKTLGRDIRLICRFCMDGIGEMADLSCGDAWYYDLEKKAPVFDENEGRNLIFARNEKGEQLLRRAIQEGYLAICDEKIDEEYLNGIQRYQYHRKATLRSAMCAMRILGRSTPKYDVHLLKEYSKTIDIRSKAGFFKGTLIRGMKGKI